jgi:Na+-driven multidrug efflux pump
MNWVSLIQKISKIGIIISLIIAATGYILLKREIKNPKNQNKVVEDTSIEKYMNIYYAGIFFALIFILISIILR